MYPDRYHFIAVLESADTGSIGVYFPDLPGCVSGAETMEKAIKNAEEVLSLHIYGMEQDGDIIPKASDIKDIKLEQGEIPLMVDVYMKPYRERMNAKYIKKTLSIPNWLNTLAEKEGINFSQVLQNALKQQLNIDA